MAGIEREFSAIGPIDGSDVAPDYETVDFHEMVENEEVGSIGGSTLRLFGEDEKARTEEVENGKHGRLGLLIGTFLRGIVGPSGR